MVQWAEMIGQCVMWSISATMIIVLLPWFLLFWTVRLPFASLPANVQYYNVLYFQLMYSRFDSFAFAFPT